MTENEQKWLEIYLETGDDQAAVREAYPNTGKESKDPEQMVRVRASQLKKKLAVEIDKGLRQRLSSDASTMLKVIKGLAISADSEAVKLNAARDWLDRAGYKPVEKTEDVTQKSADEIKADGKAFLMQAGLTEEQAEDALKRIAREAIH